MKQSHSFHKQTQTTDYESTNGYKQMFRSKSLICEETNLTWSVTMTKKKKKKHQLCFESFPTPLFRCTKYNFNNCVCLVACHPVCYGNACVSSGDIMISHIAGYCCYNFLRAGLLCVVSLSFWICPMLFNKIFVPSSPYLNDFVAHFFITNKMAAN